MRLLSTTALAGMIALAMAGCGSSGETENNVAAKPTTSAPQSSQQPEPKSEPKTAEKPTLVAQKPETTSSTPTAGLIQPTNPNQRTQQVQKGRSDPFAGLFTIAPPKVAVKPKVVPSLPKLPVAPPPVIPPAPPQPDLARGVVVLGVVEVGSQFQAIVQVPNEATSRYVGEGQRLSDGQVLVKRIEINPGSEPFVILEQNGIEVTRAVGEEQAKPEDNQAAQPTAAIPVPATLPANNRSSLAEVNNILLQEERSPGAIPVPTLPASRSPSSANPVLPPPPAATPASETKLQSDLKLDRPPVTTPELPPSPKTQLQSQVNSEQPPVATSVPSPLASNSVSRTEVESHLDDVDYPPPAIRVSATPPSTRKMALEKLRRKLKLN